MRPRVLIVDDRLDKAETPAEGVHERGYDAMACGSGPEAARGLEDEAFDALVTDVDKKTLAKWLGSE